MEPVKVARDVITWSVIATHVGLPLILLMLGWLVKQNKDARTQMSKSIDTLTEAVQAVHTELQHYRETWIDRRENLLEIINSQFTVAQTACREMTDIQLAGLKEGQTLVCTKIDDLKKERVLKWGGQEKLNTKLLTHMADSKLHNKDL